MGKIMARRDMINMLKDVPPSDPEMEDRIYTEYIRNGFIIYDYKKNKAVCTRCGSEWDIAPGEYSRMHGLQERCWICGDGGILLAAGRGREKYTEYHRVLSFAQANGTMYAFLNCIVARFENWGRPSLYGNLEEVYVINSQEQTRWHLREQYCCGNRWYESVNNLKVPEPPHAPYCFDSKWQDHVYTDGLMNMLAESECRYVLGAGLLLNNGGMDLPTYIGMMMKYHSVELLAKAGFNNIAQWKINGNGCRAVNWRGNSLEKILKLPRADVKRLREWDPSVHELEKFQSISQEQRHDIPLPLIRDMLNWDKYDYEKRAYVNTYKKEVEAFMPLDKWIRWAKTQESYMQDRHINLLRDYKDYINACVKLGRDVSKKSVLRPKDLRAAHDEASNEMKIERSAAINKAIAENNRAADFKARGLMVRSATCQEDLNKESAKLCHCVKTYGDKLARGECYIFFIRNAEAPDEPFYTLETRPDGSFVQCRGLRNCSMTDEIKLFTDAFVKKLKAEIRKERETICQTA